MDKEKMDKDLFEDEMLTDEFDGGNKKGWVPVVFALLMILVIGGVVVGMKLYEKYSYSKETMDLSEYYKVVQEGKAAMVVGDEIVQEQAVIRDGNYYLPLSFVKQNLNDKFYYDRSEKLLLFTTPTELYEMPLDSASYTVAEQPQEYEKVIWILQDEVPYVELDFVSQYSDFLSEIHEAPSRVQIYLETVTKQVATVGKNTAVRYRGGIKSEVLKDVKKGDRVYVLEQMETWSKVKTEDAIIGYVENKRRLPKENLLLLRQGMNYRRAVNKTEMRLQLL